MELTDGRVRPRRGHRFKMTAGVGFVGALAAVTAACGSNGSHVSASGGGSTGSATSAAPASKAAAPVPGAARTSVLLATSAQYGKFLTTRAGFALYTYTADDPGGRGCNGECLKIWPPLLLAPGQTAAVAAPGVSGLGTFHRGSSLQVTFHGLPLYTFVTDKAPGEVKGQNFVDSGGKWLLAVVSAPAAPATTAAGTTPATPASTAVSPATAPPATAPATTAPPATAPSTTAPSSGGASF